MVRKKGKSQKVTLKTCTSPSFTLTDKNLQHPAPPPPPLKQQQQKILEEHLHKKSIPNKGVTKFTIGVQIEMITYVRPNSRMFWDWFPKWNMFHPHPLQHQLFNAWKVFKFDLRL